MVDSAGLVPIAKAKDMVKGSILTLSEIEAGGKEYLRTDGYENMDVTDCDTLLKKKTIFGMWANQIGASPLS